MSDGASTFEDALIADIREHGGDVTFGPLAGHPLLIMTSKGAKTGESRRSILSWSRDGDDYVVPGTARWVSAGSGLAPERRRGPRRDDRSRKPELRGQGHRRGRARPSPALGPARRGLAMVRRISGTDRSRDPDGAAHAAAHDVDR